MTTGNLLILLGVCAGWCIFAIYAGMHKENNNKPTKHKHKHA